MCVHVYLETNRLASSCFWCLVQDYAASVFYISICILQASFFYYEQRVSLRTNPSASFINQLNNSCMMCECQMYAKLKSYQCLYFSSPKEILFLVQQWDSQATWWRMGNGQPWHFPTQINTVWYVSKKKSAKLVMDRSALNFQVTGSKLSLVNWKRDLLQLQIGSVAFKNEKNCAWPTAVTSLRMPGGTLRPGYHPQGGCDTLGETKITKIKTPNNQ